MIKFSLRCSEDHVFDSWFRSGDAFESLGSKGMLACPVCGSERIAKSVMTPSVGSARGNGNEGPECLDISQPASEVEALVAKMKRYVAENSEYVGRKFAEEARAIHSGAAPKRSILGEASLAEAIELAEDGVPVAPIPWDDSRKSN